MKILNSTFNARVQNKRDTQENWEKNNPVLLDGEIIIVDLPDGTHKNKTGDGVSNYAALQFDGGSETQYIASTLKQAEWNAGQQILSIPEVTAKQNGFIGLPQGVARSILETAGKSKLYVKSQDDGTITVGYHGEKPNGDIPVAIILM